MLQVARKPAGAPAADTSEQKWSLKHQTHETESRGVLRTTSMLDRSPMNGQAHWPQTQASKTGARSRTPPSMKRYMKKMPTSSQLLVACGATKPHRRGKGLTPWQARGQSKGGGRRCLNSRLSVAS